MERLIRMCTELGYRQMVALIGDKENGTSAHTHERLGFITVGNLTAIGLKFGRWVDVCEMQLALGDGSRTIPGSDPKSSC
jgi:phosphinothricin acetyltransferase